MRSSLEYNLRKHITYGTCVNQIDLKAMSIFSFQMDSHGQSKLAAETNDELIFGWNVNLY